MAEHPWLRDWLFFWFRSLSTWKVDQKTHFELSCWFSCFSFLSVQLLLVMKRENLKPRALLPSWTLLILFISFMTQLEVAEIIRASSYLNPFSTCPPRKSILIIISKLKHLFHCSRSGKKTECKLLPGGKLFKGWFLLFPESYLVVKLLIPNAVYTVIPLHLVASCFKSVCITLLTIFYRWLPLGLFSMAFHL